MQPSPQPAYVSGGKPVRRRESLIDGLPSLDDPRAFKDPLALLKLISYPDGHKNSIGPHGYALNPKGYLFHEGDTWPASVDRATMQRAIQAAADYFDQKVMPDLKERCGTENCVCLESIAVTFECKDGPFQARIDRYPYGFASIHMADEVTAGVLTRRERVQHDLEAHERLRTAQANPYRGPAKA